MIALLSLTLLTAVPDAAVLARVGEHPITAAQLRARAAETREAGGAAQPAPLLEDLINESVLAEEGARRGLARDAAVKAEVEEAVRKAAAERLLKKELAAANRVDEKDLLAMFHASGDSVALQMIVVATEDEARALRGRLEKGASFAEEAKASLDPDAAGSGGKYPARVRGQLPPALAQAAFAAPLNALTGPVKLEIGWALLRVTERQLANEAEYPLKRAQILQFAQQQQQSALKQHLLRQLRARSGVKVDEAFIKTTGTRLNLTPAEAGHVVAKVNGRPIKLGAVSARITAMFNGQESGHVSGPAVKTEFAWSLVDQALLEEAALKERLDADDEVRAKARIAERDAVVRAFSAQLRRGSPAPTAADVEGWYRAHPDQFVTPAHRACAHLLVLDEGQAAKLRKRLVLGESFDSLAAQYSADASTASRGGDLGLLTDSQLQQVSASEPALGAALRDTPASQISSPVQSRAGWHLVRCGPHVQAAPVPLAKVREAIAARLARERGDDAVRSEIALLRKQVAIQVDKAALQQLEASQH